MHPDGLAVRSRCERERAVGIADHDHLVRRRLTARLLGQIQQQPVGRVDSHEIRRLDVGPPPQRIEGELHTPTLGAVAIS